MYIGRYIYIYHAWIYLLYLIWLIVYGKCRQIYHTWVLWVMGFCCRCSDGLAHSQDLVHGASESFECSTANPDYASWRERDSFARGRESDLCCFFDGNPFV